MNDLPETDVRDDAHGADNKRANRMSWPVLGYVVATVVALVFAPLRLGNDVGVLERISTQALSSLVAYAGLFAVGFLVVSIGKLVSRSKRPISDSLRSISIIAMSFLLLATFGQMYTRDILSAVPDRAPSTTPPPARAEVVTAIATQSSEGVTEADMDQPGLMRLQEWIVDMTVEKTALVSGESTFDAAAYKRSLNPESVYLTVAGMKLAVTKMRPPGARMVSIMGIRGDELIRVICARDSAEDIVVLSGACGAEIARAFQITLPSN
jgi:hypothetical protein